ncbi:MAG: tetratricopeptide repeat-containing sensor histidine kinase [Bacteroidota bacterium]
MYRNFIPYRCIVFLVVLAIHPSHGQTQSSSPLPELRFSADVPDSVVMHNIALRADSLIGVDNQRAEQLILRGLSHCETLKKSADKGYSTMSYNCAQLLQMHAYWYYGQHELNEAVQTFHKAERAFARLNKKTDQAESLNNRAVILNTMGNNKEAIQDYHAAISIYESLNDSLGKGYALNNVSRIYRQQNNLEQSLAYINEALQLSRSLGHRELESLVMNSKAGVEKDMGDTTSALQSYERALSLRKERADSTAIASVLNNIGAIYKGKSDYSTAIDYFLHAKDIAESKGFRMGIGHTTNNLGEVYFAQNQLLLAEENGQKALEVAEQLNTMSLKKSAAQLLMNVYKQQNNWQKAFEMQSIIREADASIINQETRQIAQREAMRYTFEKERALEKKEEEQREQLEKERQEREQMFYLAIILVAILLLVLLLFVINRLRSARQQNKLIQKQSNERKLLLQEVHHRVKNNFQIVSSLLRLQSHSIDNDDLRGTFDEAVSRINAMAIVHDIIYRQEKFSAIDSKEYLEKLVSSLQKTSGNQNINIAIHSNRPKLKIETLIHLGIALNELVINSLKYAFKQNQEDPKIDITLKATNDNAYELVYRDNGVGINKELNVSSFGMELIETLIEHLEGTVALEQNSTWPTTIVLHFKDL